MSLREAILETHRETEGEKGGGRKHARTSKNVNRLADAFDCPTRAHALKRAHPSAHPPSLVRRSNCQRSIYLCVRVGEYVYAHFAGHLHIDHEQNLEESGIDLFVTDATWDDEIRLRVVTVSANEHRVAYEHELVVVPQ